MDIAIFLFLLQDGVINGALYALVALALVLVFAVTRVILIPQGEFVAFAALTVVALEDGKVPGTVWLLITLGVLAVISEVALYRRAMNARWLARVAILDLAVPAGLALITSLVALLKLDAAMAGMFAILLILPMGSMLYRLWPQTACLLHFDVSPTKQHTEKPTSQGETPYESQIISLMRSRWRYARRFRGTANRRQR